MKLGIIGLAGAGRATVFEALTGIREDVRRPEENRIGAIRVPDDRVDALSRMYNPKKTTYAQVEYMLPGIPAHLQDKQKDPNVWGHIRNCDALIHVLRNFQVPGGDPSNPSGDFSSLDQDLILADLVVAEKRLERLNLDHKRGKKADPEELRLLEACVQSLESEIPLRKNAELATAPCLRGYAFLSAKPVLVLINNDEEDSAAPALEGAVTEETSAVIRGKLEQEISQMTEEEAAEFLSEFDIRETARDRIIQASYDLLGLISFFTVGEDEVRAWTIRTGTLAPDAADTIHSDMKKGFIRAEVLAYDDLMSAGNFAAARKEGTVRLEGKTYVVADGDILNIRFNV